MGSWDMETQRRDQHLRPYTTCAHPSVQQCTVEQSTLWHCPQPRMRSTAGAGESCSLVQARLLKHALKQALQPRGPVPCAWLQIIELECSWLCRGDFGRLGHGDCNDVFIPQTISSLSGCNIVKIACGDTHTLAVTDCGDLYAFGRNQNGQLGLGTTHDAIVPQHVEALKVCSLLVACMPNSDSLPYALLSGSCITLSCQAHV